MPFCEKKSDTMKRYIMTFILLTVLLLTGCSGKSKNVPEQFPQTLSMKTEVPSDYPENVVSYTVNWFAIDEGTAVETLMRSDFPCRIEYAVGPQYSDSFGEGVEYLNIHSGIIQGGFFYQLYTYGLEKDWLGRLNNHMRLPNPWEDYDSASYMDMEKYPNDVDLDFLDMKSALSQAETALAKCGITDVELEYTESRTVALMNHNREQYNVRVEKQNPEVVWPDPFTKAQENYYFVFRRTLDGIPFANCNWPRTDWSTVTNTPISVVISTDGLIQMAADGLFEVCEPLSTDEIISPHEALGVYLDEYNKSIHFTNTEILGIELNYVVVIDGQGMYAKPAWILTTATEHKAAEYENAEDDFIEYDTIAVSAYSGIILERETDTR